MVTRNADSSQGVGWSSSPSHGPHVGQLPYRAGNTVFKSGTLFISSKGIGWTSWKKRWFVLTQSSLVFFRSDPSLVTQKSGETNLTLGGIDLNNSGSVVVKADKKLLTVLFPDGRDGRTFTLKAETLEDLLDWKNALEAALEQAPSAAPVMGQNGILRNDAAELADSNLEQCRDKQQLKSLVVGRPILLALEDIDGSPSFLEKALKFLELYGVKEEGILRQAADVDDVERRVREYQEGKSEFSPGEDAHVIADCVKHVLRELPSSPVPAACCNALLEAYRSDRGVRVNAMCAAIAETFPEPNCRLLQRILKMMKAVASHKAENRMSLPAVAACMAPLLLRPLLAGDCELGNDFKMGGDGSVQLLQAAAAANHAQAIVITLLEEYNNIFEDGKLQDGSYSPEFYSDTEGSGSEDEGASYEDEEVTDDDDECNYSQHDFQADAEDDPDNVSTGTFSESIGNGSNNINDYEVQISEGSCSYESAIEPQTSVSQDFYLQDACQQRSNNLKSEETVIVAVYATQSCEGVPASTKGGIPAPSSPMQKEKVNDWSSSCSTSTNKQNEPVPSAKRPTVWGRTSAIKNLSPESIDYPGEDEAVILRLDIAKNDLQNRIAKEEKGNVILKSRLGRRKEALHDHRLALEQDVARLQEQLQLEIDLREALEAELSISSGSFPVSATIDCTIKSDLEEIAVADVDVINLNDSVSDLQVQLDQRQKNHVSVKDSHSHQQQTTHFQALLDDNRQEAIEITEPSHPHQRTRNTSLDGEDCENVRIQEHQSLSNKQASHKKLLNSLYDNHMKSKGVPATSSAMLPVVVEPAASSTSKKSSMKNTEVAPADCENLKTRERGSLLKKKSPMKQHLSSYSHSNNRSDPPSLLAKQPSQKQQLDLTSHNNTKSVGISTTASPVELIASSNTKTSGSKSEGTVSTSSALTKLTTRLNFLKERRIHIANELQNLDKARGLEGQSVGDPPGTSPK